MTTPDFFLVGAPKCGTTSMNEYLKRHPQIFVPDRKELHFFGSDLRFANSRRIRLGEYLEQFAPARSPRRAGETSVWYLYSTQAAAEIHRFCPHARILIMLRDPVDTMYALHSQFLHDLNEDLSDFGAALAAEEERSSGRNLPAIYSFPDGLQYRRVSAYALQVERYLRVFGRDRVHVVRFDDLKRDPKGTFQQVLRFLEVDVRYCPPFEILNANKQVRSKRLQRFLNFPSQPAIRGARALLPVALRRALLGALRRFNCKQAPRPAMDGALRKRLQAEMRTDVERLSELLDWDFTDWCRPSRAIRWDEDPLSLSGVSS